MSDKIVKFKNVSKSDHAGIFIDVCSFFRNEVLCPDRIEIMRGLLPNVLTDFARQSIITGFITALDKLAADLEHDFKSNEFDDAVIKMLEDFYARVRAEEEPMIGFIHHGTGISTGLVNQLEFIFVKTDVGYVLASVWLGDTNLVQFILDHIAQSQNINRAALFNWGNK